MKTNIKAVSSFAAESLIMSSLYCCHGLLWMTSMSVADAIIVYACDSTLTTVGGEEGVVLAFDQKMTQGARMYRVLCLQMVDGIAIECSSANQRVKCYRHQFS